MGRLEVHTKERGRRSEVELDGPLTVGRSRANDIVLRDMKVSRHHCVIEPVNGVCKVRDTGSSTGTWVNRKRVTECEIRDGDRIRVGQFDLRYFDDRPDALDDTALAMDDEPPKRTNGLLDVQSKQSMPANLVDPDSKSEKTSPPARAESQTRIAALEEQLKARNHEVTSLCESLSQLKTSTLNDINALRRQLDAKRTESEAARKEADAHREALHKARQASDDACQRLLDLETKHKQATEESERRLTQINAIQAEIGAAQAEADQLRDSLQAGADREQSLQAEIKSLSEEASSLREQLEAREKATSELQEQSSHSADDRTRGLETEVAALQKQVGSLTLEREELKQQVTNLTAQAKSDVAALKKFERQLEKAKSDNEKRVDVLESEAESLRQEVAMLAAERENLEKKADELKQQIATRDASLKAMSAQLEAAEDSAKNESERIEAEITKHRDVVAKANSALSQAKIDCEAAQNESERLQKAMQRQESAAQVLSAKQATLQEDHDALAATLEAREQEARDASHRAEQSQRELELQLNQVAMLESELEAARARSTDVEAEAKSDLADLRAMIELLQNELSDREKEAGVLRARLAEASKNQTKALREPATEPTTTTNVMAGCAVGPLVDSLTGKNAIENGAPSPATVKNPNPMRTRAGLPVYPEDRDYLTWVVVGVVSIAVITLLVVVVIQSVAG